MTMAKMTNYAESHVGARIGERYEQEIRGGFYGFVMQELEAPLLRAQLGRVRARSGRALDIACGTGRITRFLAGEGFDAEGLDVSEDMLRVARQRYPGLRFSRRNIAGESLGARYDVITAFRFFQNAEPALQASALQFIEAHLAPSGRAIVNLHCNPATPYGLYQALRRLAGLPAHRGTTLRSFQAQLPSGLMVERVIPYGYLPRFLFLGAFARRAAMLAEYHGSRLGFGWQRRLAQHFLIVLRHR